MVFIKKYKWLFLVAAALSLWFVLRQCSGRPPVQSSVYYIARNTNWYPLQLMGKDHNLVGFTDDLLNAIGKETNLHLELIDTGPDTMTEGLNTGIYDAIFTSSRPNVTNEKQYLFSNLIFDLGPVLVVRANSKIRSLQEMEGMTIAVPYSRFNIYNAITKTLNPSLNYMLVSYDSVNKALDNLAANITDGVILDQIPAYTFIEGFYKGKLKVVTPPLNDEGLRVMTRHGLRYQHFIHHFNEALSKLEKNGTYDDLLKKWDLINPRKAYLESPSSQ